MKESVLWSLRLGFSAKQAENIDAMGIRKFLKRSYSAPYEKRLPQFLKDEPKSLFELSAYRKRSQQLDENSRKELIRGRQRTSIAMKEWWLDKMRYNKYPLREKMVVFWHNHFVSSMNKVRPFMWVYQHNMILRKNAFGNFRELTKLMVQSNAMVHYLDNVDNRKGSLNENLSRELLELFTLGEGNYTEKDIKEGAKALAGLALGNEHAQYRPRWKYNGSIQYLGRRGKFDAEDIVDIIFDQPEIPYLITRKIMQWFLYDEPKEEWVRYYGDYLRKENFEIEPFLTKMMAEEAERNLQGRKIKDPLVYLLQLLDELNIKDFDSRSAVLILRQQGMDLFNQPNVKGWEGGNSWITSQILLQRNQLADVLCRGRMMRLGGTKEEMMRGNKKMRFRKVDVHVEWDRSQNSREIIDSLSSRMLSEVNENLQQDLERLLKYDFDTMNANSDENILRLFNYMVNSPEFHII